ncbi:MAG: acyl carrier protein [bacterium]|nr:acyl carrier protein [bacterium]MCP5069892.1 acyl carrier protein [bacterium]
MASTEEIWGIVRKVLRAEFSFADEDLRPAAHLADDLDLDSVDAVALLVRLEDAIDLEIEEDDLQSLTTLQDVVDLVAARLV